MTRNERFAFELKKMSKKDSEKGENTKDEKNNHLEDFFSIILLNLYVCRKKDQ